VLPKDSERFDFLDNRLFRNSYRLKAEDVFDLRFLERNRLLVRAFRHAREYVRDNPRAARRWPVGQFARGVIPGEEAVVVRMLYEIVGKLELPAEVMTGNLLFFEEDATKPSGFGVRFLEPTLMAKAPGEMLESYFQREYPKRVLFLRYALDPDADLSQALDAPVANVEWYLADSRDDVEQRLLELNELGPNGTYREYALVVDEPDDLERLKAAVALRETVKVNGSRRVLRLENFRVGRKLVVPQMQSARGKRMFLADRDVAEYFYKSDFYYSALQRTLEQGYNRLQELTGGPDVEAHSSEGARR
jgi:hypothetical protein